MDFLMCPVDGSRVIECGITRNFDGEVTLGFAAEGLRMRLPLSERIAAR